MFKSSRIAKKAWIIRRLNQQLRTCKSKRSAAAYKAHATRKINAL